MMNNREEIKKFKISKPKINPSVMGYRIINAITGEVTEIQGCEVIESTIYSQKIKEILETKKNEKAIQISITKGAACGPTIAYNDEYFNK